MKNIFTTLCLILTIANIKVQAQFTYLNDECSGAIPLVVNPSTEFIDFIDQDEDLADPARSPLPACGGNGFVTNDLWYTFKATQTNHFIRVIGADIKTELFSGTCGALTSISCAKDYTGLNIGQTYYLRVYKSPSSSVDNVASHLYLLSSPTNDDCNTATLLTVNPPNVPFKSLRKFSTKFATPSTASCIGSNITEKDLWFKFVATATRHTVYWFFKDYGHNVRFYTGAPGSFTIIGTSILISPGEEMENLGNLTVGQTYYIRVSNTGATDINFDIAIADIPTNDECINADTVQMSKSIECENSFTVNTLGATSSTTSCNPAMLNDTWYIFKATAANILITRASAQNASTRFSLLDGSCNALTCLVPNATNVLSYNGLTLGNYYYLRVNNSSFYGTLSVCISPSITNDECSGAINIDVQPFGSNTTVKGTNYSATQSLPKCISNGIAEDVWYQFTAIDTACYINLKIDNSSANFEVFSGSCVNPISILCVNNNGSRHIGNLTIGTTYFIRCYSQITSSATFSISLTGLPSNDDCANAMTIGANNNLNYVPPTSNGMLEASVSLPPCSTTIYTKDVWYKFSPSKTSGAIISHADANGGTAFYQIYSGNCAALNSVSCFSHGVSELHKAITINNLLPSQTYYIRQYGDKYTTTLSVVNPPSNDLISGAVKVKPSPSNVNQFPSYSLHGASNSFGRICTNLTGVPQHDVWFYFIAESAAHNIKIGSLNSFWQEQNTGITYRMEAFKGYAADSAKLAAKKLPCTATPFALTGLTVGDTIFLRVYNTSPLGTTTIFSIDVNSSQNIDEPMGALELTTINDYQYQLTTTGATQTLPPANCKTAEFSDDDIWLKFNYSNKSKRIVAGYETKDIVLELFSGTPSDLTSLFCSNNIMILPTNLSIGTQYYVRAYSKANVQASNFKIGLFDDGNALSNTCVNPALLGPNLVKNPTCETDYVLMPGVSVFGSFIVGAPLTKDWWSTINTTADIWDADYPLNFRGNIPEKVTTIPHGGKGMLGMLYQASADWSEYVTGELVQPLTVGKYYMVSFYAKIDDSFANIGRTFKQVGAMFTSDRRIDGGTSELNFVPNIALPNNAPLTEVKTWRHVCGIMKADAAYRYITLGNFGDRGIYGDFSKEHYMFVDDVLVAEVPPSAVVAISEDEAFDHLFKDKEKATITLYPNPANDMLGIQWSNKLNSFSSTISISDISGKEIWHSEVLSPTTSQLQVDIKEIPTGFYVVTLKSDKGMISSKLIIVR